jgi:hypothetical protein
VNAHATSELESTFMRGADAFQGVGGGDFQARCDSCLRSSPVVSGVREVFLSRAAELGWSMTDAGAWRCPLCSDSHLGRYALR